MDLFEKHFLIIDNFLVAKCKLKSRNLIKAINFSREKYSKVFTSVADFLNYLSLYPWTGYTQVLEMSCMPENLFKSLLLATNLKCFEVGDEKTLFLKTFDNSRLIEARKRVEFTGAYIRALNKQTKFCYFGIYPFTFNQQTYAIKLFWTKCGHVDYFSNKYMFVISISPMNATSSPFIVNIVSSLRILDSNSLYVAVFNDHAYDFAADLLAYQTTISCCLFNRARGELDPFTSFMRCKMDEVMKSLKSNETLAESVYLAFTNAFLAECMERYHTTINKIYDCSGF